MKLKTVHTYQSVRFNKRDETHFDAAKATMAGLEMEFDTKLMAIRIRLPDADDVLVFSSNVAYAVIADEPKVEKSYKK